MTAGSQDLRQAFLRGEGCPVIDLHGHLGPFHGIFLPDAKLDAMVRGMDRHGVERIVLSPHSALEGDAREGNDEMLAAVRAWPGRVYGYCTVNPLFADCTDDELDRCLVDPGVAGVKIHPTMHGVSVEDPRYESMWTRANRDRLLVLSHTWGKTGGCGASDMRVIAERYPNVRLLLGHSCYGAVGDAIALAAEFPNVYLELTAIAHQYGVLEWMCRDAGSKKVVFGTDYPWFDYGAYIGFVTFAHLDEASMRDILYRNAQGLLDEKLSLG
ncbi:MAG: amidohydrolase family protein [bacterium]|nr:amidohydrolase family protein [bacterium]